MKTKKLLFGGIVTLGFSAAVLAGVGHLFRRKAVETHAYPTAAQVTINGESFDGHPYYKNGVGFSTDPTGYNAYYDDSNGTLTLDGYVGGAIESTSFDDLTVFLQNHNSEITVNGNSEYLYGIRAKGDLTIGGDCLLSVEITDGEGTTKSAGISSLNTVSLTDSVTVRMDMLNINDGLSRGLEGGTGVNIDSSAELILDITSANDISGVNAGIYADAGDISISSNVQSDIHCYGSSGTENYAIYNAASNDGISGNGDISICDGGVSIDGYYNSSYNGIVTEGGSAGEINIWGAAYVEIDSLVHGIWNKSDERDPSNYDILIDDYALVEIYSKNSFGSDGLISESNGISISGADYTFEGNGYPVNCMYDGIAYNHSDFGFDVMGASHVSIKTGSYIATTTSGTSAERAKSTISLTEDGYFEYGDLDGGDPRYEGDYYIVQGPTTRMVHESRFCKHTEYCPAGTFWLSGWSEYAEYPVRFEAYSIPVATGIEINGQRFSETKIYYVNNDSDTSTDHPDDYNAKLDPATGTLYLKNYVGGTIFYQGSSHELLTIVVEEDSKINAKTYGIDMRGSAQVLITTPGITRHKLEINMESNSGNYACTGIGTANGDVTISGSVELVINADAQEGVGSYVYPKGIYAGYSVAGNVTIDDHAVVDISVKSVNENSLGVQSAILANNGNIVFDTNPDMNKTTKLDTSGVTGQSFALYAYHVYFIRYNPTTIKWSGTGGNSGACNVLTNITDLTNGAVNFDNPNKTVTLKYGTPHHVTIVNGYDWISTNHRREGNYVEGETVYFTCDTIAHLDFAGWEHTGSSTISSPNASSSYLVIESDEVITATYDFVKEAPRFDTRGRDDNTGYISFVLKGSPEQVDVLNESDDSVQVTDITLDTELSSVALPNGTYYLRAKYENSSSEYCYLKTSTFNVVHNSPAVNYDVTYHAGEGSSESDYVVPTHGEHHLVSFASTSFVAPEGKRFYKWGLNAPNSGDYFNPGAEFNVKYNLNFYAVYEVIPDATVSFACDEHASNTMDPVVLKEGDSYVLPAATFTPNSHYHFDHWNVGGVNKAVGDSIDLTGNITITACYAEDAHSTVSFSAGDGTGSLAAHEGYIGDTYVLPTNPGFDAPEHFEFHHWVVNGVIRDAGQEITLNVASYTAEARYSRIEHTVTYSGGIGSGAMDTEIVGENLELTLPECEFIAPAHKQFKCWQIGGEEFDPGDKYTVLTDITVTAVYEYILHTVSFSHGDGTGSMSPVQVVEAQSYTLPSCGFEAPEHKQFKCWSIGGVEYAVGAEVVINADTEVIAVYKDIMHAVNFSAGEGSGTMSGTSVKEGNTYALPECGFTAPTGQEFDYWLIGETHYAVGNTVVVNSPTTITAIFKDIPAEPVEPETTPEEESTTPATPETPESTSPEATEDKPGLSGGAIAGIVVGSVVVAGVGGFALTWFVIKKKSWAALVEVFKKIPNIFKKK